MSGLEIFAILVIGWMCLTRVLLLLLYYRSVEFRYDSRFDKISITLGLLILGASSALIELIVQEKQKPFNNTKDILYSIENHLRDSPKVLILDKKRYTIDKSLQRDLGLLLNKHIKNILTNY